MRSPVPRVGCWYKDLDADQIFEVVALDSHEHTIEIQLLDGEVDEYDLESWAQSELVPVEEPEDWRNPFEIAPEEDGDATAFGASPAWDNPLSRIEPEAINGLLDAD